MSNHISWQHNELIAAPANDSKKNSNLAPRKIDEWVRTLPLQPERAQRMAWYISVHS